MLGFIVRIQSNRSTICAILPYSYIQTVLYPFLCGPKCLVIPNNLQILRGTHFLHLHFSSCTYLEAFLCTFLGNFVRVHILDVLQPKSSHTQLTQNSLIDPNYSDAKNFFASKLISWSDRIFFT